MSPQKDRGRIERVGVIGDVPGGVTGNIEHGEPHAENLDLVATGKPHVDAGDRFGSRPIDPGASGAQRAYTARHGRRGGG